MKLIRWICWRAALSLAAAAFMFAEWSKDGVGDADDWPGSA